MYKLKILRKGIAFTKINDDVKMYTIGGIKVKDNKVIRDVQYWHKIGFGFYRLSDSWLN